MNGLYNYARIRMFFLTIWDDVYQMLLTLCTSETPTHGSRAGSPQKKTQTHIPISSVDAHLWLDIHIHIYTSTSTPRCSRQPHFLFKREIFIGRDGGHVMCCAGANTDEYRSILCASLRGIRLWRPRGHIQNEGLRYQQKHWCQRCQGLGFSQKTQTSEHKVKRKLCYLNQTYKNTKHNKMQPWKRI